MNLNSIIIITTASLMLVIAGSTLAFAVDEDQKIKQITLVCDYVVDIPKPIDEKMITTLQITLERILVENDSRSIESYIQKKKEIEASIIDGLNIVLEPKGYSVESLNLEFGETTKAYFLLKPYGRYIKEIAIELDAGNLHPFWYARFNESFQRSHDELIRYFEPLLKGLPVGAEDSDWAFNLVKTDIYNTEIVTRLITGMDVEVRVEIAEKTSVIIKPKPSGNLVKTLRVRALSRSLFQMTLDPLKELVTSHSNMVVGMPVELVKDAHKDIEAEFVRLVDEDTLSKKFNARSSCRLYFLEKYPDAAFLELKTESSAYHFRAEAIVDIGNDKAPTEFESHIGAMIGKNFECFVHLNFFPDDVRFNPDIGFGLHPFAGSFFAAGWDITDTTWKIFVEQYINPYVHIEVESFESDEGQDQYGIVYKPFQSVGFGVFSDGDDDYWLRASFAF